MVIVGAVSYIVTFNVHNDNTDTVSESLCSL